MLGHGLTLVRLGRGAPDGYLLAEAVGKLGVPFHELHLESDSARRAYGARLMLVGPRGEIGWRSDRLADHPIDVIRGLAYG